MAYEHPASAVAANMLAAQVKDLRAETEQLRAKLRDLVAEAKDNQQKMQRFQAVELRLMGCGSVHELIRVLVYDYRVTAKLDRVTLYLLDPDCTIRRVLEDHGVDYASNPDLVFSDATELDQQYPALARDPYLGVFERETHGALFPPRPLEPRSVALLPLRRRGRVVGLLNLGSVRIDRFTASSASDFLERFAAVVAMCVENATHHAQLKHLGHTDTLTNIANRRLFDQRLREEISRVQREQHPLSCLFFDVDFFKKVNDTHGHAAGDVILREVALTIKSGLRATDVLARYGGEEFAVILPRTGQEESAEIAERIRASIAARAFALPDGQQTHITVSIGAATLLNASGGMLNRLSRALVDAADEGVFIAKNSGRNQVRHRGAITPES